MPCHYTDVVYCRCRPRYGPAKKEGIKEMAIDPSPDVKAALYAHSLYAQRRIDIADNYTQQCSENRERLASDLADIALEYNIAPTRVIRNAFGADRTDFVSAVRRALAAKKAQMNDRNAD